MVREHGWMNGPAILAVWEDHLNRRAYRLNEIWTIVGYQLWWRAYRSSCSRL
jgi:hypothetical protein